MKFTSCKPFWAQLGENMRRQRARYFSPEEKRKFLDYLASRADARRSEMIYKLMFATGLRLQETVDLNVAHVADRTTLVVVGKGKKEREIPLSSAIRDEIRRFLDWKRARGEGVNADAALFISATGMRFGPRGIEHDLNKWVRLAGLEGKYSPHALRHTVGFELMRKTGNIRQVQEFLGHSFVTTTQIYTHVTKEELRNCAELLVI